MKVFTDRSPRGCSIERWREMTEEKREQNNVSVCFIELCSHVRVCDIADAAGVESMRGYLEVGLGGHPKLIGEHKAEELDSLVYLVRAMNNRGPVGGFCEMWLSRAEILDLYEQLAKVADPDYEKKVMERMSRRTP